MSSNTPFSFSAIVPKLSQFSGQILVAVVATGLTSALFGGARAPAPTTVAQNGKYELRIADAAMPAITMALYPQDLAALSSLDRFKPMAFIPAPAEIAAKPAAAAPRPHAVDMASVLPPPRPKLGDAPYAVNTAAPVLAPVSAQVSAQNEPPAKHGLTIAGVSIPTPSVDFRKYIPTGGDVARNVAATVGHARSAVDWLTHVASR